MSYHPHVLLWVLLGGGHVHRLAEDTSLWHATALGKHPPIHIYIDLPGGGGNHLKCPPHWRWGWLVQYEMPHPSTLYSVATRHLVDLTKVVTKHR